MQGEATAVDDLPDETSSLIFGSEPPTLRWLLMQRKNGKCVVGTEGREDVLGLALPPFLVNWQDFCKINMIQNFNSLIQFITNKT